MVAIVRSATASARWRRGGRSVATPSVARLEADADKSAPSSSIASMARTILWTHAVARVALGSRAENYAAVAIA